MRSKPTVPALLALLCCAACVTSEPAEDRPLDERFGVPNAPEVTIDPELFVDLSRRIDEWVRLETLSKSPAELTQLDRVERYLRQTATNGFEVLVHAARSDIELQRRPSLVLLGFSGREEAIDPLLAGLRADDDETVDAAVLGLAVLADPRTPPAALGDIMRDESRSDRTRQQAAWALYMVQREVVPEDQPKFLEVWRQNFRERIDAMPGLVIIHTLRGVGLAGDASMVAQVEPFLEHPKPRVRMAAAQTLGMLGDLAVVPSILKLLEPSETNDNVRLWARKALQSLAGGVDRGYDPAEWRRVFDLSRS